MNTQKKKVALKFATFAALFGLMTLFMQMMVETEEQTTYSVTLEDLAHGQSETNGEAGGGGGADGEAGRDGTGGQPEQKETVSDERCPARYDISYNVTLTTTGSLSGNVSGQAGTNALLKKLLAALKVKFGVDASEQLATTAALSGNLATYEIRYRNGSGSCVRKNCGAL